MKVALMIHGDSLEMFSSCLSKWSIINDKSFICHKIIRS